MVSESKFQEFNADNVANQLGQIPFYNFVKDSKEPDHTRMIQYRYAFNLYQMIKNPYATTNLKGYENWTMLEFVVLKPLLDTLILKYEIPDDKQQGFIDAIRSGKQVLSFTPITQQSLQSMEVVE